MKPRIFIASASENLDVADAVAEYFRAKAEVSVWNKGVFLPSATVIEDLFEQVKRSDFALVVFHPTDVSIIKGTKQSTARDNVVFELGLFAGALGRDRCFAIRPDNTKMRIPSDLLGVTIPTYDYTVEPIEDAVRPGCDQLWQAICRSLQRTPLYLQRYAAAEEPPLGDKQDARIGFERAYKILLYMFRNESFDSFCALDLAFHRWAEILGSRPADQATENFVLGQALNISSEILNACDRLFRSQGCKSFRRILVIDEDTLQQPNSKYILMRLQETETSWRTRWPSLDVETRVLQWSKDRNTNIRTLIAQSHDFAIFQGDHQHLAIVETSLTAPTDTPAVSQCELRIDAKQVNRLRNTFDTFWQVDAKPIADIIEQMTPPVLKRPLTTGPATPALEARSHYLQNRFDLRSPCAVIIEAGYFDQRAPKDEDRFEHIRDAMWLRSEIQLHLPTVHDRILMESFINDFSDPECGFDCPIPPGGAGEVVGEDKWRAHLRENPAFADIHEDLELFFMKETRNRLTQHLSRSLKEGSAAVSDQELDSPGQIVAKTQQGKVVVGHYAGDGTRRIIARCAGLMAQHYYDLFRCAIGRIPDLQELWIFDFNRSTEAQAVKNGAAAAIVLFPWKPGFRLKIVNAIYAGGNTKEGSIWTLTIP